MKYPSYVLFKASCDEKYFLINSVNKSKRKGCDQQEILPVTVT